MRNSERTTIALLAAIAAVVGGIPAAGQTSAEELRLSVGKSVIIDYPSDVRQISTSNPEVADANPVTTREILVSAKGLGTATVVIWSKTGQRTFYTITVDINLDPLRRLLKETFPNEDIHVQASRDSISLTGQASSAAVLERSAAMAAAFGKTVVNNLHLVAPADRQILLRVKFAELDRSKASQFGVNLLSTGAANTLGGITTQQFSPPRLTSLSPGTSTSTSSGDQTTTTGGGTGLASLFTISDALNIFMFRPDLNLGAFIQALQNETILQILAEPNLVTTNGKEATFLVGGEFPVPILQGGANSGAVTVQFREFGIRLMFTPQVTENGTIKMHLRQEVSTLDYADGVTISGFSIPALSSRKAETEVELGDKQSFVVAGLIDNRETETMSKVPGLSALPVLGQLFKSKNVSRSNTELVMIVTPEITEPLKAGEKAPMPYMPRDFLKPIKPEPPKSSSNSAAPNNASKPAAQSSGWSWLKPWSVLHKDQ